MNNIVYSRDLKSSGVSSAITKDALECCLLKLGRGIYSIIARCEVPSHRRLRQFIDDENWIRLHHDKSVDDLRRDYDYQDRLQQLRILHYPHYREDDVVSGISAALMHRIPMYRTRHDRITMTNPKSNGRSKELVRNARHLDDDDVEIFGPLRLTNPVKTCLDLIRELGQRDSFAAFEAVLRHQTISAHPLFDPRFGYPPEFLTTAEHRVTRHWLPAVARMKRSSATARRMIAAASPLSESIAESFCSFNFHALGLDVVEQQVEIFDTHGLITRVDFLHEPTNTIIMVDGVEKYVKTGRALMRRENTKHNRLLAAGYRVIRLSFSDLLSLAKFARVLFSQAPDLRAYCRRDKSETHHSRN